MSRNGSGTYSLPAGNPVVTGTTISSTWANNTLTDIATALTQSLARDGQTTPTGNIPLGNFRLTGVGAATARTDAPQYAQVQNSASELIGSIAGTNTITGNTTPALTAYTAGQTFRFIPAATNTGATTINIDSLGAKNIFARGVACVGNEIVISVPCEIMYDGTQFNIIGSFPTATTWTPVLTFVTPGDLSVTYSTQTGTYTRYGRMVVATFNIATSAFTHTTASGNLNVTGLPFSSNVDEWQGTCVWAGVTKANYTQVCCRLTGSSSTLVFTASGSGQALANIMTGDMPTGGTVRIFGTVTYLAST